MTQISGTHCVAVAYLISVNYAVRSAEIKDLCGKDNICGYNAVAENKGNRICHALVLLKAYRSYLAVNSYLFGVI